jgi:iron(III) transport system permease protein
MLRRTITAVILIGVFGVPLVCPLLEISSPRSWAAWAEADRILELAANTVGLCLLTLLLSLPFGLALAALLYRTDVPGARMFRGALGLCMFVPLPLFALAWQSIGGGGWRPWTQGMGFAALVHSAAALPWVVWLTGLGLSRVEPELEEDALTVMPAWLVTVRVSLRRASPAIGLAVVWIALQTIGEITVTDLSLVRTFAEEVYTQFVTSAREGLGRSVAICLPFVLIIVFMVAFLMRRWQSRLTFAVPAGPPRIWKLGRGRWLVSAILSVTVGGYTLLPLVSLICQAGGGDHWSIDRLGVEVRRATTLQLAMITSSLGEAVAAGLLAAGIALVAAWIAVDSLWLRRLLFVLVIALWAVPGPVLGFGIKEAIARLMDLEDILLNWTTVRPLRATLYDLSTPAPVLWAHVARLLPYAVAVIWPAVRDVPRDLREVARVDGAGPWSEFRKAVWPFSRGSVWIAVIAVTALALGELAASKIVQVPGRQTFAQELFNQMHYSATATTASLALVLLVPVGMIAGAIQLVRPRPAHFIQRMG